MHLIRGALALLTIMLSTLVVCIPLYLMGLGRAFTSGRARVFMNRRMDGIIVLWVGVNRVLFRTLRLTRVEVSWEGADQLSPDRWYLIVSNHQTWADILILQNTFWGRLPPIKFFTKRQLIWIPLLGVAMWLLGFPYVRRMNRKQIAANPELAALDRRATLDACDAFRDYPSAVLNFLEGTRFTPAKHDAQTARFQHLLNPKLGGLSYAVAGLHDRLHKLVDVTLSYPAGVPTFWGLLSGRCPRVEMQVQCRDLPVTVDATADTDRVRAQLTPWIETLWHDKDRRLGRRQPLAN